MYVDDETVKDAVEQLYTGDIDLREFANIVEWFDGDIAEFL